MGLGVLESLFARAAAGTGAGERRFHPSQSPPGWVDRLTGWDTATGVTVTPDTAMQTSAVFACVRILAETVASLPLRLYERRADEGRDPATRHPLYPLLHDLPNPEMTSYTMRQTMMGHLALRGNALAEIEYSNGGDILGLWPLRVDKVRSMERRAGVLYYVYEAPDHQLVGLPAERVFHVRGLGSNGLWGLSPIELAKQAVGLALATEEFGARFFGNGARPGMVLTHPNHLSDEAHKRLRESWEARHKGLDKAMRIAILEEGMGITTVGIPPNEAQFLETRKYQVTDVCRIYRIPPHMAADLDRATFSNIEHLSLEFVIFTLMPWLVNWEQEISRSLLTPAERARYFAEHLVAGLLRGDTQSRYEAYAQGRTNGWLSANDIRRMENMNPIPGGDVYLVPLNMWPADKLGELDQQDDGTDGQGTPTQDDTPPASGLPSAQAQGTPQRSTLPGCACGPPEGRHRDGGGHDFAVGGAPTGPGGALWARGGIEQRALRSATSRHRLMKTYRRLYRDAAGRIVRRECSDVAAAAKKYFGKRDYGQFSIWLEEFYRDMQAFMREQMGGVASAYGEEVAGAAQDEVGQEVGITPEVERWIDRYLEAFASRHSARSADRIRLAVRKAQESGGDPLEALDDLFEKWRGERPDDVAREESCRFNNALARFVYVQAGVMSLRWVAFGENCPYCSGLNGQVVGINSWFLPAGSDYKPDGADAPLRPSNNVGHAPAHDGCDCMCVAA